MMNRRNLFIVFAFFCILVTSGCGSKAAINQPVEDEKYYYKNKDLGFSLTLPKEFIYYQTQRKEESDNTIIEFFVPTSDREYEQEVPSYGKVIVVRIFDKDGWSAIEGDASKKRYDNLQESKNKVYILKFWDKIPVDWQSNWDTDLTDEIINKFEVN